MKSTCKLCIAVLAFLVLATNVAAAPPAPLSPAAQEALDKGIIAAKVPDYLLAIRYFEEARKLAPQAPVVFLNMGLAESRISGRELRAMTWFGAYLAAYPDAPNAAAVKEQIAVLDVRNQSNLARLVKTMEDAANQIPKSKVWLEDQLFMPDERRDNLLKVAELWQNIGDFPSALRIANGFSSAYYKSALQADIGFTQIKAGDINGARRTFTAAMQTFVRGENTLNRRVTVIAAGHAKTGDIVGALQSAATLKDDVDKSEAQYHIALQQIRAGDVEGSRKTFMVADQTVERIQNPDKKIEIKLFYAEAKKKIDTGNAFNASGQSTSTIPPPNQPVVTVSDWLKKLDDDNTRSDCPLSTEPFLDLAGYLKTLPSGDAKKIFNGMFDAAERIVKAQNVISGMLKQQAKR